MGGVNSAAAFEALCAQHGVDAASIPDRPARQSAVAHVASAVALGKTVVPRSSDRRASRQRRRTLGSSGALPPELREEFTEGQQAVLAVIAGEIQRRGRCALFIDQIATRAGVCRRTVQYTLRKAGRAFLLTVLERPQRGGKHLSHVITMLSDAWREWIRRRPKVRGEIGCTDVHTTENRGEKPRTSEPVGTSQEGLQGVRGRGRGPDDRR